MSVKFMCTVLLITYNHSDTVARAVESILEQDSCYPFKIHACDDGSTDGTKDILNKYAKQYPDMFFNFIAEYNQGAQANYWKAFNSVDTPYCILLEGDDFYCNPQKLEMQIRALEEHPECSFCGHDTYLYSEGESFREYEQGSRAMTAGMLRDKALFKYEDFVPVETGGYIPYGSARMIRTSALRLDEIKYKEAVLFDFTQFYYLLLHGDYYYIDLPMSAYVRTGLGVCSGKSPMAFLNDFIQASIDFNKQTDNVIADKIYSDCALQIGFRLQLYRNSEIGLLKSAVRKFHKEGLHGQKKKNMTEKGERQLVKRSAAATKEESGEQDEEQAKDAVILLELQGRLAPDSYYYLCNGGMGHTMLVCAYKHELERRLNAPIVLLVTEKHAFIPQMYCIQEYVEVDLENVNLERIASLYPNPEKGNIYVTHPFTHPEAENYYRPVHGLYSSVRYLPWLLKFMNLSETSPFRFPEQYPIITNELKRKLALFGPLDKIALFFPEAQTLACIAARIWKEKAKELTEEGFVVLSCVKDKRNTISGTTYVDMSAEEAIALGVRCGRVYCMRSGIAELLAVKGKDLYVYYPSHAVFYIYSVNSMLGLRDINEKIVLDLAPTVARAVANAPQKAYVFGRIPVPQWCYRFYLQHKRGLRHFKKLVRWH